VTGERRGVQAKWRGQGGGRLSEPERVGWGGGRADPPVSLASIQSGWVRGRWGGMSWGGGGEPLACVQESVRVSHPV
jgi:hypothetical protein